MVVRGWDAYARSVGFENVDRMLAPYLKFSPDSLQIYAIRARSDGYAAQDFSIQLRGVEAQGPHDPTAEGRNDETDGDFRIAAEAFISDLYSGVINDRTFNKSADDAWDHFREFVVTSEGSPPPSFDKEPIKSIRILRRRAVEQRATPDTTNSLDLCWD